MITAPRPPDEQARLASLYELEILDTPPEERFDRIGRLARTLLEVPIAFVSLVDENRQWLKAGEETLGTQETCRDTSFCGHAILSPTPLIIPDAREDERFHDNPLVTGPPHIRFYAGYPLSTLQGFRVGTLCVVDHQPRELTEGEQAALNDLARMTETELNFSNVVALQQEVREANRLLELRNQFIRRVLGQYISEPVAEALLESPEKLELGGERRRVTLMMTDLRGFTELSTRVEPEEVVRILNDYLGIVIEIINKFGGTIDNIIGDALLVLFGTPVAKQDDALRAVACAVEMQRAVMAMKPGEVAMGVGISTGDVVVGNIGTHRFRKYSVIGNAVNLAARIEAFTLGGQILICEDTLQEVKADVRVDGRMRVKVKGIPGPVFIYEVGGVQGPYRVELPPPPYS